MKKKKVAFHNLGCKVNSYETEAMLELLEDGGYEVVPFDEKADIYVINTCTVTNIADRKSRQMLHRAKKQNPDAIVVAAGCYAQAAGEKLREDGTVDIIIGNNKKKDLPKILKEYENHKNVHMIDINHTREYEELAIKRTAEHTRAYIKVQDGCNQFCSYCIIPFTRGRVRSRALSDVISEVENLAHQGYQEVVLTGIHLSSYGTDREDGKGLLELIEAVHDVPGIRRIRLGSLEPRIITEMFAATLAGLPKVCPHFHLSLQSGCDETLKRMNRRYSSEEYYEKCCVLRKYFDNPALTTDVIVGFPGETDGEFEKSRAFIEKTGFYETHIFKYSRREGTRAAGMPDQVPEEVKTQRSHVLLALDEKNRKAYEAAFKGKKVEVLFEDTVKIDGREYYRGYTKEYLTVIRPAEGEKLTNKICDCIL